jgi:hypothetical protein
MTDKAARKRHKKQRKRQQRRDRPFLPRPFMPRIDPDGRLFVFGSCIHRARNMCDAIESAGGAWVLGVYAPEDMLLVTNTNICEGKRCRTDHSDHAVEALGQLARDAIRGEVYCRCSSGCAFAGGEAATVATASQIEYASGLCG